MTIQHRPMLSPQSILCATAIAMLLFAWAAASTSDYQDAKLLEVAICAAPAAPTWCAK